MCKVVENMAKLSIESQIAKYEHTADFCKQKADRCWAYARTIKATIIMKKRVTTTKKKKRTEKKRLPYEQNCNEVIHNGILGINYLKKQKKQVKT